MTTHQNLADIFSIFHDGTITDWSGDMHHLRLTIECEYLAELINPTFDTFYVELFGIEFLEFEPWPDPVDLPVILQTDIPAIFQTELGILNGEVGENCVKIICETLERNIGYVGGILHLNCSDAGMFNQQQQPITLDRLKEIATIYWNRFQTQ